MATPGDRTQVKLLQSGKFRSATNSMDKKLKQCDKNQLINWRYICTQLERYPQPNDRCLYKIGVHARLLNPDDLAQMRGGQLTSQMRSCVLHWLQQNADKVGKMIDGSSLYKAV